MSADPSRAVLALHRFGLGARPGDLGLAASDPKAFLKADLAEPAPPAALAGLATTPELTAAFRTFARLEREARAAAPPANAAGHDMATPPALPPAAPIEPPLPQRVYRDEAKARFHAALQARGGYVERLVAFWSNHFCVSVGKGGPVRVLAGAFEREAVRPHVLGRFSDLLLATATHPAMIFYLDNQQSIGPNSRAGQRRGRGLNENLAREILELHTLGVAGGYTQADVTSLARIITGWSLRPDNNPDGPPGSFHFNANLHEPGDHALLGRVYPEAGFEQGRAALIDIARHPSTAQHVARKLARHFVADDPPASLVARLARVFRDSEGDLALVSAALLDAPESWSQPATKMRTPFEFLVATARACTLQPDAPQILGPMRAMGQELWRPPGPNGFPDVAGAWASPEGIKTRLDVAAAIGRRVGGMVDPRAMIEAVLGPLASAETRQAVMRAESRQQGLALALMAPEFQRR